MFTRVLTDRSHRFDEIAAGYQGQLYLEIVPLTFAIRVKTGLSLNQVRLIAENAHLSDEDVAALHRQSPLVYLDSRPVGSSALSLDDGLFLSLDLSGSAESIVGYRAKKNSLPIDLAQVGALRWQDYWEPVHPETGGRIVLEPEIFYLLLSAEGVSIPPSYAAEMLAYDPTAGELRTHYAGFFDPGFGYSQKPKTYGSRAALEVRARDVAFMVEHHQPVCKLAFERMREDPDVLYGEDVGSNYQGQQTMLSKHFAAQTAGVLQRTLPRRHDRPNGVIAPGCQRAPRLFMIAPGGYSSRRSEGPGSPSLPRSSRTGTVARADAKNRRFEELAAGRLVDSQPARSALLTVTGARTGDPQLLHAGATRAWHR